VPVENIKVASGIAAFSPHNARSEDTFDLIASTVLGIDAERLREQERERQAENQQGA
jgi:hypothetical protein